MAGPAGAAGATGAVGVTGATINGYLTSTLAGTTYAALAGGNTIARNNTFSGTTNTFTGTISGAAGGTQTITGYSPTANADTLYAPITGSTNYAAYPYYSGTGAAHTAGASATTLLIPLGAGSITLVPGTYHFDGYISVTGLNTTTKTYGLTFARGALLSAIGESMPSGTGVGIAGVVTPAIKASYSASASQMIYFRWTMTSTGSSAAPTLTLGAAANVAVVAGSYFSFSRIA